MLLFINDVGLFFRDKQMKNKRLDLIDTLRGLAVISMIGFHACWIINLFRLAFTDEIITGPAFMIWERSICMSFILISGFSFSLGRRHLRSGLVIFGLGLVITVVTVTVVPEIRIVFGVLTFLGTATLLMIPADKVLGGCKTKSRAFIISGLIISLAFFLFTYNINKGFLGAENFARIDLPKGLYNGYIATFIGFTQKGFVSADYFSLIPWFFLYLCGYFIHKLVKGTSFENNYLTRGIPGIAFIGRHSLLIYIIHPVVLYVLIYMLSLRVR